MMSVRSPQCSMPSSSPFLKEESASCMRIRDMTGKRFASRSASGVTLQESHGRSADAGVLRRIDAGSWKRRTPGSTDSESSWSDMRNYLKATRRSSISLLRSSVGGRWQLFTDKSLVSADVTTETKRSVTRKTPARLKGPAILIITGSPLFAQRDGTGACRPPAFCRCMSGRTGPRLLPIILAASLVGCIPHGFPGFTRFLPLGLKHLGLYLLSCFTAQEMRGIPVSAIPHFLLGIATMILSPSSISLRSLMIKQGSCIDYHSYSRNAREI